MKTVTQFPAHLQAACDEAIADFKAGEPEPKSLETIIEWLKFDGWDYLTEDLGDQMAISLWTLADLEFQEKELRVCMDIPENVPITDADRIEWGRSHINRVLNECDGYLMPSIHTYELKSTAGEAVVIGCLVEIHGQAGAVCQWKGLWVSRKAFLAALGERNEYWVTPLMGDVPDEVILSLWHKPKRSIKPGSRVKNV